ncbi:hypothetical protein TcasGA2_TC034598 [Tribolium castaneum]|uniref:SAM domain-containing protein n=1 Tax=Tribolium castaneum TaxID=7070 RepID=A0A139WLN4_TRICA|nr:PREDICTED: uncharacterized protein LOC103314686 [Tribolium castaneum]KYB28794.1 hypothetical protein TcasGA2_TC034598 [Tribolium castaneum]|eukprot:XP_008199519.1 PREDICTED: uncharacterized protein LOC103314686 [Tribolium castaneum]
MNILDTVLCTSKAEKYSSNFKQFSIDAFTLKLLNEEDLKILGIEEEEIRLAVLQHANNLQIPAEKHTEVLIDEKYVQLVLAQMSMHLTKHLAALSIAVNRRDTIVCNVQLKPAAHCLQKCVESLEKQLDEFEQKIVRKNKKIWYKQILIPIIIPSLVFASFKAYRIILKLM